MHKTASFLLPEAQNDFVLEVLLKKKKKIQEPQNNVVLGCFDFFFKNTDQPKMTSFWFGSQEPKFPLLLP